MRRWFAGSSVLGFVLVLLIAIAPAGAGAAEPFSAHGSVEQVYATGIRRARR